MAAKNNRKHMLMVLAALVVIRFVFVPIIEWQSQKVTLITAANKKLTKGQNIIAHAPQIERELNVLKVANQTIQNYYVKTDTFNAFKLQTQQKIEALFKQHQLQIKNFSWVAEIPGEITQARASIAFAGNVKDVALLQVAIARLPKLLNIGQWTLHIKRMNENSLGKGSGRILLIAYNLSENSIATNSTGG
jgi:hypothetical protein